MDMITTDEHVKMEDQICIIVRQSVFLLCFCSFSVIPCLYLFIHFYSCNHSTIL